MMAEDDDLQDFPVGRGLDEALGEDVDQDVGEFLGLGREPVERRRPCSGHADAGLDQVDEAQAQNEGDGRQDLEIDDGL